MTPDLPSLVQPLTEAEFVSRLHDRTLTLVRGSDRHRFETLVDWDTLDHLIETGNYPLTHLRVQRESTAIPSAFFVKDQRVDPAALASLLAQGVSVILNGLDNYVPRLRQLCRDIASRTGDHVSAEAVITSGRGGAIKLHYDPEDIAVLQVAGTKRWQVYEATITHPVRGMPKFEPPRGAPALDEVLGPGDLLFVPGGQWHHCQNGPDRSLHLSILMYPPNGRHLLTSLAARWLSDPVFRRPLTRHADAADLAAHEAALKAHLIEHVQGLSLEDFLADDAAARTTAPTVKLRG